MRLDARFTFDALVVGGLLLVLLRNADRVRIGCLAQLVNVIAPIRTRDGGPAWREAIYHPVRDVFTGARGTVLRTEPEGPRLRTESGEEVPVCDAVTVHDAAAGTVTLFALNRGTTPVALEAPVRDLGPLRVTSHTVLTGPDLRAVSTPEDPERVAPRAGSGAVVDGGVLRATLPPSSWTTIRLGA